MLRCEYCRGHAHAGLAHLHGLPVPLCQDCTRKVLERRNEQAIVESFKMGLTRIALSLTVERSKENQQRAA